MSDSPSRRAFTEAVDMAAVAPLIDLDELRLSAPLSVPETAASSRPSHLPGRLPAQGTTPAPLARALAEVVRSKYGQRLSEHDLAVITHQIQTRLDAAAAVRAVPLSNAEEPAFTPNAFRGAER